MRQPRLAKLILKCPADSATLLGETRLSIVTQLTLPDSSAIVMAGPQQAPEEFEMPNRNLTLESGRHRAINGPQRSALQVVLDLGLRIVSQLLQVHSPHTIGIQVLMECLTGFITSTERNVA